MTIFMSSRLFYIPLKERCIEKIERTMSHKNCFFLSLKNTEQREVKEITFENTFHYLY